MFFSYHFQVLLRITSITGIGSTVVVRLSIADYQGGTWYRNINDLALTMNPYYTECSHGYSIWQQQPQDIIMIMDHVNVQLFVPEVTAIGRVIIYVELDKQISDLAWPMLFT